MFPHSTVRPSRAPQRSRVSLMEQAGATSTLSLVTVRIT